MAKSKNSSQKKHRLAKNGQGFGDFTNQKNDSQSGSQTSVSSVEVPFDNASSTDFPSPRRKDTVLTVLTPRGIGDEPICMDASPCSSLSDPISLDERCPEFVCIDNEEVSGVETIKWRTNSLYIPDDLEIGSILYRDMFAELTAIDKAVDIDKNFTDPQFCASIAFASDAYKYLRAAEANKRPSANFMERIQKDINANMRAILVDWLVEVSEDYKLVPDTLFLTINYIDRYLSDNLMSMKYLQLLGIACMLIAAGYVEISPPDVEEFCNDNAFSRKDVLEMKTSVLHYLKFERTAPTTISFLKRFVCAAQATSEVPSAQMVCLAKYITELSLVEYSMLRYTPSLIAASAVFLAKYMLTPSKRPWDSILTYYTLYKDSDLFDCVKALHYLCCNGINSKLPALRKKYSQQKSAFSWMWKNKDTDTSTTPEYVFLQMKEQTSMESGAS
ncbi:cyclin-A1-4-like [Ziziphus jujuba]|uniref:B-like cyclin n=1 Tax=Ziziphus jujuba TaxID=326968 RepID=A0ABM4A879_ZIZJJ|nr:cyclin-A1-4-like [Ziziphus jujuba]